MIRIITSRAGYGKTESVYKEILAKDKNSEKTYLMVPEQFTLQSELVLMDMSKSKGLIYAQVMSFERLSRYVLSRAGGLKRPHIDEVGKHMALRLIFDEYEEKLPMYKSAYRKKGFLNELSHTLSELKKMAVSPAVLIEKSNQIENDVLLKQKLFEIGFIYERFLDYMKDRYIDNEDRISLLAEKIDRYEELSNVGFYFDSFTGFTALELCVIKKLSQMGACLCFALTYDENSSDREVFSPTGLTIEQLKNIARSTASEFKIEPLADESTKSVEIRHIERSIYDYKSLPYEEEVQDVKVFEALDMESEAEHCAVEIMNLVRDYGYRFKDILIITPMPQLYCAPVSRVFARFGIPYFLDIKRDIMSSPLITLIFSYLDMHIKNLRYEDVFSFLKSGFTQIDESLYMPLENFVLKWGIKGGMWPDKNRFEEERFFDKYDTDEYKEKIRAARDYVVSLFELGKNIFKNSKTGLEYAKALFDFLDEIRAFENLETFVDRLREENAFDYANENAQIWNIILDTLDQFVEIMGEKSMSLEDFRNIFYEGISRHEVGIIPPALDQVIVATLDRSRSTSVKALFFMGLNDTYVPHVGKDSPILLDDDKKKLKDMGVNLPSETGNTMADEALSIYSALSKANDKLFLSYSLSAGEDGKALRPSTIINRIKTLFVKLHESSFLSETSVFNHISTLDYSFEKLAGRLRDVAKEKRLDDEWLSLYGWYVENDDWKEKIERLLANLFYKNQIEYITFAQANRLYETPLRASVSRLEKFAKCPFEHFVGYALQPEPRKIHEIGAPELGTVFHSALEKFAKLANDKDRLSFLLDRKNCDAQMDALLEESVSDYIRVLMDNSKRNAYMMKKMKKVGRRAAWTMVNHMSKGRFKSYDFEMKLPPIVIDLGEYGSVELIGQIDRVDILDEDEKTYVKIIDYKSREKKFSLSDTFNGLDIQLSVYLKSVLEHLSSLKKTRAYPAGAFYFPIVDKLIESELTDVEEIEKQIAEKLKMQGIVLKDINIIKAIDEEIENSATVIDVKVKEGDIKSENALSDKEFEALLEHVTKLVRDMSKEILSGKITIKPYSNGQSARCDYCDYASICKFDALFEGNTYKTVRSLKDKEVKELLVKKEEA